MQIAAITKVKGEKKTFSVESSSLSGDPSKIRCKDCKTYLKKIYDIRDFENEVLLDTYQCQCGNKLIVYND